MGGKQRRPFSGLEHGNLAPPWRERLPDGTLGDELGPVSNITGRPVSIKTMRHEYSSSIRSVAVDGKGGGFWDFEAENAARIAAGKPSRLPARPARPDAAPMARFVQSRSTEIPRRELEVYVYFYLHNFSHAEAGNAAGLAPETVRSLIKRLRIRLREWPHLTLVERRALEIATGR